VVVTDHEIVITGRIYSVTVGAAVDVPDVLSTDPLPGGFRWAGVHDGYEQVRQQPHERR
jgi:hypothetical protein